MATIVGGFATSHTPTIGFAVDTNKQNDPIWAPIFKGYEPVQKWLKEQAPDVIFYIFNDHMTSFFMDHYSQFALGVGDTFPVADEGGATDQGHSRSAAGYSPRCADCWSVGVIGYIAVTGALPFEDVQLDALRAKIYRGVFSLPRWLSPHLRALLKQLLRVDPAERIVLRRSDQAGGHPRWRVQRCAGLRKRSRRSFSCA